MKLRKQTLWRVPVFCLVSGLVSYYLTIYVGGSTVIAGSPMRAFLFSSVLFIIILLVGGLWFLRSMTKAEIAVSAGIASVMFLAIALTQLYWPGFPITLSFRLAIVQNWVSTMASLFQKITGRYALSVILSNLAPLLFIPFGKKPRRRRQRPAMKF